MSPAELAVLGTLGGTLAGGVFSMVVAIVSKRSEERRQLRELVVNAAIEDWKYALEIGKGKYVSPLSNYIVHMTKMCELVLDGKLNESNVKAEMARINAVVAAIHDNAMVVSGVKKA